MGIRYTFSLTHSLKGSHREGSSRSVSRLAVRAFHEGRSFVQTYSVLLVSLAVLDSAALGANPVFGDTRLERRCPQGGSGNAAS